MIPLARPVSVEEYEALGRRVAGDLGIDLFDDTTYQATRIMYYPSTAANGEFKPEYRDAPWLDPDKVLAQYPDWRDTSYWPTSSRVNAARSREAKKQGNPLEKPGIAPMPGTILRVEVAQGAAVKEGQLLVVLEAMKMENEILAPKDGTVAQVVVQKGSHVETGSPLIILA